MEWQATVDRIEGRTAVLVPKGHPEARIAIACDLLPAGVRDGSVLAVQFRLDETATAADKQDIARLQAELERGTTP